MSIEFSNEIEAPAVTQTLSRSTLAALPFFWLSIFLGAFLLFAVQLILGKYFLPWFGGTPALWTTCIFFSGSSSRRVRLCPRVGKLVQRKAAKCNSRTTDFRCVAVACCLGSAMAQLSFAR